MQLKMLQKFIYAWTVLCLCSAIQFAQTGESNKSKDAEVLTNQTVIEMTAAGLDEVIIISKIRTAAGDYDVSAGGLIALKKAGVADEVVAAVVEATDTVPKKSESALLGQVQIVGAQQKMDYKTPAELVRAARAIAFVKTSAYPSQQDLESSLLKRQGWKKYNFVITRYKDDADLVVQIGREFLTHYNFRVLDVKTGRVIAASGVSSLGGALAGNIADKLVKRLDEVLAAPQK